MGQAHHRAARCGRALHQGMTLMEMVIVTAVVALVMAGMSMGIGSLTRQKLTSSSVRVAALVRTAYSRSATTGKTVRIVFDLDTSGYWVEEADGGRVLLSAEDEDEEDDEEGGEGAEGTGIGAADQANALASLLGDDPDMLLSAARGALESDSSGLDFDMLGAMGSLGNQSALDIPTPRYKVPRFSAPEGSLGRRQKLESGIAFERVETSHREHPAEEGKAYLYFFPGGITEAAVIQVRDSRGYVNSVEVHALTGRCRVHNVPYELPVREEDRNEAREAS